jgi:integrase
MLWRAGLRIHEALALNESDLDHRRGALLVRRGKGGRRREVGMDEWAWEHLQQWIDVRLELPVGPLFCVINGRPADDHGRPPPRVPSCAARRRRTRSPAFRTAPTAPRPRRRDGTRGRPAHRHPTSARPQNLGITSIYLQGIDNAEIIDAVHGRRAPTVPVSASLRL